MEERGGFFGEGAGKDFDAVIQPRVRKDFEARADRATARIVGAVNEFCDTGLDHGAGTHRTGLERDVHCGAGKAIVGEKAGGFAEDNDFRVGGGVVVTDGAIAGLGDDFAVVDEKCADRNFSGGGSGTGFPKGELHEIEISGHAKKE